jgi:hypothetical protein
VELDEFVWRNPKGEETPVVEMDDRHLRNCIALINRRLTEHDFDDISDRFWRQWADMLPLLLAEQRRRADNHIRIDPPSRPPKSNI